MDSSSPSEVNNGVQSSPMSVEPVVSSNGNGAIHDSCHTPTTMTPEQEEEIKLRMKYPNPQKPGGSTFIQKMLYKGCKKYFDSGDYNMAKSRTKAHVNTNGVSSGPGANAGQLITQQKISEEYSANSATPSPVIPDQAVSNQSRLSTSPQTSSLNNSSLSTAPSSAAVATPQVEIISTPSSSSASSNSYHHYNQQQQTPSIHTRLSSTNINNSSPLILFPSSSSSSSSTTSTSTSSLHQMSSLQTSRQLLSSSTSASNIMGAAAAMSVDPVLLNSADEIGHGIPTPECLPQSRKHAISQSKLATPRLSSS